MVFYLLNQTPTGRNAAASIDALTADGTKYGDAPRCEACGDFLGMRPWLPPYRVELETWGSEFGDLAFPTADDILVSLRFKQLWEREGLVGLSGFEPVEVVKVRRHRKFRGDPPPYFKAAVVLSRAVVDNVASAVELEEQPMCPVCQLGSGIKRWKAIIIKPETWNGEDIFQLRWVGGFYVTNRFKEFCEANDIKNAVLIPAEEYGHDFYPWEKKSRASGPGS
jgi:hypothetical protein